MEVFVHNVPKNMTQNDLTRALASVLHGKEFERFNPSGGQLNFDLNLFKERRRRSLHRGIGALTLGSVEVAQFFLRVFGDSPPHSTLQRPFIVALPNGRRGGPIKFQQSRNTPRPEVVRMIRETPYIDPQTAIEREKLARDLEGDIVVNNVQFGWQCRDDSFSVEWDAQVDGASGGGAVGSLAFDLDSRELRITMPMKTGSDETMASNSSTLLQLGPFASVLDSMGSLFSKKYVVCTRFSRVETFAIERSSSGNAILLSLWYPPSFEIHPSSVMDAMTNNKSPRTRLHAFNDDHARVAPYTSLALRIVLNSHSAALDFENKAAMVQFPQPYHIRVGPGYRQLFSTSHLDAVNDWAKTLEWRVAFQVMGLLSDLVVDPTEILALRARIESLIAEYGEVKTAEILRLFCGRLKTLMWAGSDSDGAKTIEECLELAKLETTDAHMHIRNHEDDDGYFNCHHCTVTPTRMILEGPFPDQTNRVLRRYRENNHCFLRVNFVDEEQLNFRWDRDVDGAGFVRTRVGGTLKNGFDIAGRHFDFLAYSSSALREHAVWFCTPFEQDGQLVTASTIRQSLGNFSKSIKCAARYGARLSQAFTATEAGVTLQAEEFDMIPDITSPSGSNFTDGIGQLSPKLNKAIIQAIKSRPGNKKRFYYDPSAWQVRMGGYKGMLACNYKLQDMECYLRPSMSKFDAPYGTLDIEIAGVFNKPSEPPLTPIFFPPDLVCSTSDYVFEPPSRDDSRGETLGVPAQAFIKLQDAAVDEIQTATESIFKCARLLEVHGVGGAFRVTSVLLNLKNRLNMDFLHQEAKYTLDDSFLNQAIEFATNHILRVMKHKARIPVKGSYTLVGVIDEHKYLKPNEVFICVRDKDEKPQYISGRILITRSPQVHPGDIYNIITNEELFPPKCDPPGRYEQVELKKLDRPCEIEDLADWVADYINADILGFVADRFLIVADQSDRMCRDKDCIRLAELASAAVDFVKSGTPVSPSQLPPTRYPPYHKPDWAAGELGSSNFHVYESKRAIGQLFRRINLSDAQRLAAKTAKRQHRFAGKSKQTPEEQLSKAMNKLKVGNDEILFRRDDDPISNALSGHLRSRIDVGSTVPTQTSDFIQDQFEAYVAELNYICVSYSLTRSPLTEEEVLMGTITARTSQPRRRKDLMSRMRTQSGDLVKKIRIELAGGVEKEKSEASEEDLLDWLIWCQVVWMDRSFFDL
ncbi:hypothetical protein FRC02_001392 [Tulasnella sp. 418]|nr:hypothetical protein FRC02_001392 [Tulasnella sp. 418]